MNVAILIALIAIVALVLVALALVARRTRTTPPTIGGTTPDGHRSLGAGPPDDVLDDAADLLSLARARRAVA